MPKVKHMPCEIRFYVSDDVHKWLKEHVVKRGSNIAVYTRTLIEQDRELHCHRDRVRTSGVLLESIAEKLDAVAKKLGVELPEKESENSCQLEDENSAEKEGEIH